MKQVFLCTKSKCCCPTFNKWDLGLTNVYDESGKVIGEITANGQFTGAFESLDSLASYIMPSAEWLKSLEDQGFKGVTISNMNAKFYEVRIVINHSSLSGSIMRGVITGEDNDITHYYVTQDTIVTIPAQENLETMGNLNSIAAALTFRPGLNVTNMSMSADQSIIFSTITP